MAERQLPGGAFLVESGTRQIQIPAGGFVNEQAVRPAATLYTITGPTAGTKNVASSQFKSNANGATSGMVTVTDNGGGGTFSPSATFAADGGTFTYTPGTTGTKTLSFTNNGGLPNPNNISFVVTALPTGTITLQPPPDGQNQRFVLATADATSGLYTFTGSDGGVTVSNQPFTITNDSADFTHQGLESGTYVPTITVTGPGGTSTVTGASPFMIAGVSGGGQLPSTKTVTINLTNGNAVPIGSINNLNWAWFDQTIPGAFLAPTDKGAGVSTDAAGTLTINIVNSTKQIGETGWLIVTDSDGNTATPHKAFSGPVTIQ